MTCLLAVDLGIRSGLAVFAKDGTLQWYRSVNFGNRSRMRRAVANIIADLDELRVLYVEGDSGLAEIWSKAVAHLNVSVHSVPAERWRPALLLPRQQRSGAMAKKFADPYARRVIEWSGARRPTSLRHDAAEAILLGLYGVLEQGWLKQAPPGIGSGSTLSV